ncbi:uncharacterized protein LOC131022794 [Salvia miltiorrhiza]|uniref:uncharacterized protein LOC131022794 n=1 Tax=Salvia miltiorrhiza TaxID=226208 RepID=UPI0025ACAF81|nr:uncharacterized protein LOC131022794 [Salvia miltiorrhiza]
MEQLTGFPLSSSQTMIFSSTKRISTTLTTQPTSLSPLNSLTLSNLTPIIFFRHMALSSFYTILFFFFLFFLIFVFCLQKFCTMPTSPQSTLGSDGWSNNGGTQYDSVEDLICLTNLKLNACPPPRNLSFQFHKRPEISPPSYLNTSFENIGPRAVRGVGHVAWAPHQGRATFDGSGAAAKKVCAGTGVFLPRRYDAVNDCNAHPLAPRRRPVCSASSPFHGRETAQIHTKPLMYSFSESRPQPKISRGFVSDHNSVLARRHALVLLQRHRSFLTPVAADHPCLPPEWTY